MKKIIILLVLFICFNTVGLKPSLFAGEMDLTKFPSCMTDKNWILNLGFGLGNVGNLGHSNYTWFPSTRLSFDKNVGLGEQKLPFFFGGIVTFSRDVYKDRYHDWYNNNIGLGFRCGYHFNWGVDNLDTYAVGTSGWVVRTGNNEINPPKGSPMFGVGVGVRWFLNDFFGFWAESGFSAHQLFDFDIGLAFKF